MDTPDTYVELDRRFGIPDDSVRTDETASRSYLAASLGDLTWQDLLKERLVVVLGEPGSGKSWEFRRRCAALRAEGRLAFEIALERLLKAPFVDVLSPEDRTLFERWHTGSEPAHFFLDAVDEAKLRHTTDFYLALDAVKTAISGALERASIVISSRLWEWEPETDRQEVLMRFRLASPPPGSAPVDDATEESVFIVNIAPLDRERVRLLLTARQVENAEGLLTELHKHSAWEFARRPMDVVDLAAFWQANKRLGSLTELLEHDVTTKLRETLPRQKHFVLSEEKARSGAEALAAATVLCRQHQFRVPDQTFVAPDAMDAAACLPADWSPAEISALLSRPLFDSATYGRIRFHHSRVSEYLAASWLRKRMGTGCSDEVLLELLFEVERGKTASRKRLIPLIAWLCPGNNRWNEKVRRAVLDASPEIFLEYGDASQLSAEYRRDVLRAWLTRTASRDRVFSEWSHDAMRRLAAPELATDISQMVLDRTAPTDIREHLVQIVRYGVLLECMPTLLSILGNPSELEGLKEYVLIAVRDIGRLADRIQVRDILRQIASMPVEMCLRGCEALFPAVIDPAELVALIEKTTSSAEKWASMGWHLERHLQETLPAEQSGALCVELSRLAQMSPHIQFSNKETRISSTFVWVLDVLPTAMSTLLQRVVLSDDERAAAVEALLLLGEGGRFHHPYSDKRKELDPATRQHPALRRDYFWAALTRFRAEHPTLPPHLHDVFGYSSVLKPDESDAEWMLREVGTPSIGEEQRRVALPILVRLVWLSIGAFRPRLQQAVQDSPRLTVELHSLLSRPCCLCIRRFYHRWTDWAEWKHWLFMRKIGFRRRWNAFCAWWFLLRHRSALRSGSKIGTLAALCREAESNATRHAPANWDTLVKKRGRRLVEAVKAGCMKAWQESSPKLPHEKQQPNAVYNRVIVGLAGIRTLCNSPGFSFASLSDDDARLATRYAVNEMNGFPEWLPGLAATKPGPVREVLSVCVDGEWAYPGDRDRVHDVMADLGWEGGPLAMLVRSTVLRKLREGDPPHPEIFDASLSILLKTMPDCDPDFAALAVSRCKEIQSSNERFVLWCAVCLQLDAEPCIAILSERLSNDQASDNLVLRICALLDGSVRQRLPLLARPSYLTPASLRRLIPIVFRHVQPSDDIDRWGGPYTSTERDDACRFRDSLSVRLAQSDEPAATTLLRELLSEPALSNKRDWLLHLLDERVTRDADLSLWETRDIRVFAREYETDPKTDRDLFRIVVRRLIGMKIDVERGEISLREEVPVDADEYQLRRWLAKKLRERSQNRYTVPQEEEIDQEERPDLRVENPKTGPVSIEVKWADRWSLPKLMDRLDAQLTAKYLRDPRSRHGIYLLATLGRKDWKDENGNILGFREIIALLERSASEIASTRRGVERLMVIGMDFRSPPDLF